MPSILFHNPRATFVRVCKTGSTSIVRGIFGGITERDCVRREPPPVDWLQNFSFAFVRNPFDRLVSAFLMFRKYQVTTPEEKRFQTQCEIADLLDLIRDDGVDLAGSGFLSKLRRHVIPMSHSSYGLERIANLFRFEAYTSAFAEICSRLNFRVECIPHLRKSRRGAYEDYFSAREKRLARQVFRDDCQRFGYSF